ncbi:hypothetical protein GCM10027060_13230 [Nesterenkonia halophila]
MTPTRLFEKVPSEFWNGWDPAVHTVVMVLVGYFALTVMIRISGPRTMAQMTPLDFVIAVTIGSTFGGSVISANVPVVQAVLALAMLILIQWLLAWVRRRSPRLRRIVDAPPVLVYYQGEFQPRAMRRHQLVEDDIHTAARKAGGGSLAGVSAVILQQDGALGVIHEERLDDASSINPFVQRLD